ncbi:MAG: S8 family serine peptidase [Bacteroidia bacterium]|nr:S8 family serine peptidase [Bacteroidia bacterium]
MQNHSYGIGVQNYYGINAGAFDVSVSQLPHLVHVFSSGNSGNLTNASGPYSGVTRFANITGNLKMAKNALVVGAIDSTGNIPLLSSRGPAYDGRIKPDLVAFAEDGTSGSAALVSGAALLLQQLYRQTNPAYANAELIRALLINSADDIGNTGPDYTAGFGNLNVYRALQTLQQKNYFNAALSSNAQTDFDLVIPANSKQVKITLVWNDTAAMPGSAKALINDLDMELIHPASAQSWLPWVLNPAAHADSLQQTAKRKKDTLNNVEQVTVDNPQGGNYIIRIRSNTLQTATQAFAVAYQVDTLESFTWLYPTGSDAVASGQQQYIRWSSFFPASAIGKLEFSKDGGTNWQIVNTSVFDE